MNNKVSHNTDAGILIQRISVGLIFIFIHGIGKITGGTELWTKLGNSMGNLGIKFLPAFWGFMSAATEFIIPMMLIAGLFYRTSSALLCFNMIVATVSHFSKADPWGKIAYPMIMVFIFLSMFVMGPGKYSMNYIFKKRDKVNEV